MTSAQCSVLDGAMPHPARRFYPYIPMPPGVCAASTVEDLDVLVALKQQCDE